MPEQAARQLLHQEEKGREGEGRGRGRGSERGGGGEGRPPRAPNNWGFCACAASSCILFLCKAAKVGGTPAQLCACEYDNMVPTFAKGCCPLRHADVSYMHCAKIQAPRSSARDRGERLTEWELVRFACF